MRKSKKEIDGEMTFSRRLAIMDMIPTLAEQESEFGYSYQRIHNVLLADSKPFFASDNYDSNRPTLVSDLKLIISTNPDIVSSQVSGKNLFYRIKAKRNAKVFERSPQGALLKLMVNDHMKGLIPNSIWSTIESEVEKAKNSVNQSPQFKDWPDKVYSASFGYEPKIKTHLFNEDVFKIVMESIFNEQKIHIEYTSQMGTKSYPNLHPIGLFRRGGTFYMVAYKDGTDIKTELPRQFAIHRIQSAQTLGDRIDNRFRSVKSKDLENMGFYLDLNSVHKQQTVDKTLRLSTEHDSIKMLFSEWEFHPNQKEYTKQGKAYIEFQSPFSQQLKYWVLSFDGEILLEQKKNGRWQTLR